MLNPKVLEAYEQTDYWCAGLGSNQDFVLNVNQMQPELNVVYGVFSTNCAAFITAWNPYSNVLSEQENNARQAELIKTLEAKGYSCLMAEGRPRTGDWKFEPSVFVPGLSQEDARLIGQAFEQNAIVWVGADCIPKLLVLV